MLHKHLHLVPQKVGLGFEYNLDSEKNEKYINLSGLGNISRFSGSKRCEVTIYEVGAEHKFKDITNPKDENKDEKTAIYGEAILMKPDKYDALKEETISNELYLKPKEFGQLKYFVDRAFFSSNAEIFISLSIFGIEVLVDEFPPEKRLPIIGYRFQIASNKNVNLTAGEHP